MRKTWSREVWNRKINTNVSCFSRITSMVLQLSDFSNAKIKVILVSRNYHFTPFFIFLNKKT